MPERPHNGVGGEGSGPGDDATRIVVLGSTGSIGVQTLEVVRALAAGEFAPFVRVVGLAANTNSAQLSAQAEGFPEAKTVLASRDGVDALVRLVTESDATVVVSAMVGAAGLRPTLAAHEAGMTVALANKESLVAAGSLFKGDRGALTPIDSEHSAIWNCVGRPRLPTTLPDEVHKIILTASGGPFRTLSRADAFGKTPAEALRHPRWNMGAKISIDSATMVNKAFELIEARWLFGVGNDRLDVLIHPQSIVHGMVEFSDGSVVAHLSNPDMKGPIGAALGWVAAKYDGARKLSFREAVSLEFTPACEERWEALALARWVIDDSFRSQDSALGAVFNAANEVAVAAFLAERLPVGRITGLCRQVMEMMSTAHASTLGGVLNIDAEARRLAEGVVAKERGGTR